MWHDPRPPKRPLFGTAQAVKRSLAYEHGAVAARMTGGGFGGSIAALAAAGQGPALTASVTSAYSERAGREARACVCTAVDGAGDVPVPGG